LAVPVAAADDDEALPFDGMEGYPANELPFPFGWAGTGEAEEDDDDEGGVAAAIGVDDMLRNLTVMTGFAVPVRRSYTE
jgi:hypothetical protein